MDDFERVFSLLISDKLKSCLPAGALNYILSLEGNDWFDPRRIGELADTYVSNHTTTKMVDDLGKLFKRRRASIPVRRWCAIVASKRGL